MLAGALSRPRRCSSAAQKRRSNEALCATIAASPTKRLASPITSSAGGAPAIISLRPHSHTRVHQRLEAIDDLAAFHQDDGDFGGAVTHGGREAGGFEVDDGD